MSNLHHLPDLLPLLVLPALLSFHTWPTWLASLTCVRHLATPVCQKEHVFLSAQTMGSTLPALRVGLRLWRAAGPAENPGSRTSPAPGKELQLQTTVNFRASHTRPPPNATGRDEPPAAAALPGGRATRQPPGVGAKHPTFQSRCDNRHVLRTPKCPSHLCTKNRKAGHGAQPLSKVTRH